MWPPTWNPNVSVGAQLTPRLSSYWPRGKEESTAKDKRTNRSRGSWQPSSNCDGVLDFSFSKDVGYSHNWDTNLQRLFSTLAEIILIC